ncbi:MAG TPA: dienelactone hydrolase family protein [Tepidiformaceae bacterium]|nr:dienelactone hydrolase family protein [Tepidiformaceae bacterium]
MGEIVTFPSNGGTAQGYLAKPASGSGKGVIVFQEWWGLNDNIKGIADRFAAEGFVALAPDMYHGKLTAEPDEAGKLLMALNIEQAAKDAAGAIQYVKGITGGPVGTVGFCMGGALSLFAACNNGKDVGACIDYYGGHPAIKYNFAGLTAPVLGFWAENDGFANANQPVIEAGTKEAGVPYEGITYPGTGHAFFNEEHEGTFDKAAADDTWNRALAFYRANL